MNKLFDRATILGTIFYFSAIICILFGSYSLYVNPKEKLNRIFFTSCLSLGLWAFGFGMFIHAETMETSLFWRRIGAFGCVSFYSVLLHFLLVLIKKDRWLKNKLVLSILYAPALICDYIFAISNTLVSKQYILVQTLYGWNTLSTNNLGEKFFQVYYILYMVIGLGNVWYWRSKSKDVTERKIAYLILWSFFITILVGSFTDVFANILFPGEMPQIGPILILFPMGIMLYSMIEFGFMLPRKNQVDVDILNDSTRIRVYKYFSYTIIIGSIMSLFVQLLYYRHLYQTLASSGMILALGLFINIINKMKTGYRDILLVAAVCVAIPSTTLVFLSFGSVTIWAMAMIFIIISLIFTKRMALVAISVSILATQVIVWILMPEVLVKVDRVDYAGRIGILSLAIWLSFYVNKVYVKRLDDNNKQIKIQKFISEISTDFITANQWNLEEKINNLVVKVGEILTADRSYVFLLDREANRMNCESEWCNDGILPELSNLQDIPLEDYKWRLNELKDCKIIQVDKVSDLSEEGKIPKIDLARQGIQSMLSIPICENQKLFGFLGIDFIQSQNKWSAAQIDIFKIIVNILSDALKKIDAEKEINFMAYHDYLTGLPNRRLFKDRLNQAINIAKKTEKIVGVIFVDLDSFKIVNDLLGHESGDLLLKIVSEKLVNVVRHSDTVSRFGSDEFLIMIDNLSDEKDIISIADKIISIFNYPIIVNAQEFNLTASVGIAMYPFDGMDIDNLIKNADIAMYKAKEKGKNQYIMCSSELKDEIIKKLNITNRLYRALEQNEFYINYQPQVELSTGEIIGLEALIRWENPELGFVSPAVFIPIAEQIGLINEIGQWVLKTACEQNRKWQIDGYNPVCMAVNVSANQLRNSTIIEQIKNVMIATGLDPMFIELEITESVAMNETTYIVELLNSIKKLGISISIDDFGTDYSSLSRLSVLPIDKIKIDKQFIDGIEESEKDKAIVKTIINLAKNLDLKVIAEGVENENQLRFLKQELCNEIQGYYYYKPMSAEDVERILHKNNSQNNG